MTQTRDQWWPRALSNIKKWKNMYVLREKENTFYGSIKMAKNTLYECNKNNNSRGWMRQFIAQFRNKFRHDDVLFNLNVHTMTKRCTHIFYAHVNSETVLRNTTHDGLASRQENTHLNVSFRFIPLAKRMAISYPSNSQWNTSQISFRCIHLYAFIRKRNFKEIKDKVIERQSRNADGQIRFTKWRIKHTHSFAKRWGIIYLLCSRYGSLCLEMTIEIYPVDFRSVARKCCIQITKLCIIMSIEHQCNNNYLLIYIGR